MNARRQAETWASNNSFDLETRGIASIALFSEDTLRSLFGSELRFGTGGLRGVLGVGTSRMNRYTVARATLGLARYLKRRSDHPVAVIAHDSRHGSEEFTSVAAGVLASEGVLVHVFPALVPTPVLSYAVRALHGDAGIMITASHNPASYNGYKVYGPDGCQITDHAAAAVTAEIDAIDYTDPKPFSEAKARKAGLWMDVKSAILERFIDACLSVRPSPDVSEALKVVYTPLNGTGLIPVRETLRRMKGIHMIEVPEQALPDGDFPTCPKPNPELDETLKLGLDLCKRENADLLIATDPDCDRVGVAVRTSEGDYRRLSGNEVGLLMLRYILETAKSRGRLPALPVVVKTIVTSDLAFPIANEYGAEVVEVLTGFKYIGEAIGELEQSGEVNRFLFGFEESCGYLAAPYVRDKDGVMASMLVCEMAQACKAKGETLWDALNRLYDAYGHMETALMNFDIAGSLPMDEMEGVMKRLRLHPPTHLAGEPVTAVTDYLYDQTGLPRSNVLSLRAASGLKAIIRPSGTEPKIKIYLSASGKSKAEADEWLIKMRSEAEKWIGR